MPIADLPHAKISFIDHPSLAENQALTDDLPILLVHGFSSSIADNWTDTHWLRFLNQAGLRVIALDNRGHGKSEKFYDQDDYSIKIMAQDAVDLLDHLGIEKAHILGYSMGARIGAMMALHHGDRVGRLILGGNGYGMIEGTGDWTPVRDGLLAENMSDITDLRARAFRRFADRTNSDKKALAASLLGLRDLFTEQEFGQIDNKTLIVIGADDDISGSGQKLADCMKNAHFFSIPGRDHMRASADKAFKEQVVAFLQES